MLRADFSLQTRVVRLQLHVLVRHLLAGDVGHVEALRAGEQVEEEERRGADEHHEEDEREEDLDRVPLLRPENKVMMRVRWWKKMAKI